MSLGVAILGASSCAAALSSLAPKAQLQQPVVKPLLSISSAPRARHSPSSRSRVAVSAASTSSSSPATRPEQTPTRPEQTQTKYKNVAIESEMGINYDVLHDLLAAGEWEAADAETRSLLCVLAGEGAVKRKWVFFSEVQFIPVVDLKTVDGLWRAYSGNKFGYSVQRRLWKSVGRDFTAYFLKVGWTKPMPDSRNFTYKKFPVEFSWDVADPTPVGHLPLTNALRGTQLLEKLLCHPAFDFADEEEGSLLLEKDDMILQVPSRQTQQKPESSQESKSNGGVYVDEAMTVDYGF